MEFAYRKNNNTPLFNSFQKEDLLNVENPQNYIPLYKNFFTLSESNYNSINLSHTYFIEEVNQKYTENIYSCKVKNSIDNKNLDKSIFFKFSPLIDPIKYLTGKYDLSNNITDLPKLNSSNNKINDTNNLAYVDGFFNYLNSHLLHNYNFINGLDFYGSFLAVKNDYLINIFDDLEFLVENKFFIDNKDKLYTTTKNFDHDLFFRNSRNNKQKLLIKDTDPIDIPITFIQSDSSSNDFNPPDPAVLLYDCIPQSNSKSQSSVSSCSSRSSHTHSEDGSQRETDSATSSESEDENAFIKLPKYPIHIIAIEKCHSTLDEYISNNEIEDNELSAIIIQILFILITYQKTFNLTHNDLHTNNIMYIETDKKFLIYKYNNKYYKVPTYGKIFKIIDYGRAIFKFRGQTICSDSYNTTGDAATQYNCEPFFNPNKERIEPNLSFDLCRLGCSLYDFFVDDSNMIFKSKIIKIITDWCLDDKGKNVLYKKNGEERYPEFKLYKMIARTVHNHVPSSVIENIHFEKFIVAKKKINKNPQIIDIDKIENHQ